MNMRRRRPAEAEDYDRLANLARPELAALWRRSLATEPPKGVSRALLARLLAYDLQARATGGVKPRVARRPMALAAGDPPKPQSPRPKLGARLVREWNGVGHVVEIVEGGVLYRGVRFASLSAVARAITGARWSGPRFFGLTRAKSDR